MSTSAGTPSSQAAKQEDISHHGSPWKTARIISSCFVPSAGRATAGLEASVEFIDGCATATSAALTAVPGALLKFSHCCRACLLRGPHRFLRPCAVACAA